MKIEAEDLRNLICNARAANGTLLRSLHENSEREWLASQAIRQTHALARYLADAGLDTGDALIVARELGV